MSTDKAQLSQNNCIQAGLGDWHYPQVYSLRATQVPKILLHGAPGVPGLPAVKPAMEVFAIGLAAVLEALPAQGAT